MSPLLKHLSFLVLIVFYSSCTPLDFDAFHEEKTYFPVEEVEIISDENGWDQPANEGIKNALLNAEQLVSIRYKTLADFNCVGGVYEAGTTIKGLVYSSTRSEDLLVPNNVSLWTFMSALKNPKSYPYTVDITQEPYCIQGSAKPFYGQVCTSLIQYAFGIKYNFQIHQMTVWEGFDEVYPQDIERIRLADVLTTEKGHTRLITGIRRKDGKVVEIEITEGLTPCAKKRFYSVTEVVNTLKHEGYVFYRYRFVNETSHTQSPFVCVGDEVPYEEDVLNGLVVIPRRGDKANWRKDENVVLDIVERGEYTSYQLELDNQVISEQPIPANNVIDLGVMPYGKYSLRLTNKEGDSRATSWIVADYNISAQGIGGRKAKVSFTTKNTTPVWITWRRPAKIDAKNNNMPLWTTVITDQDRANGYVITELDSYISKKHGRGQWDIKVAFETEYGIISSDSKTVYVN